MWLFPQRSALPPVKMGEDVWMSTNARVLVDGRGLGARQVRAHRLDLHLSFASKLKTRFQSTSATL